MIRTVKLYKGIVVAFVLLCYAVLVHGAEVPCVVVDSESVGKLRPELHSSGWTPHSINHSQKQNPDIEIVKSMGFKAARTHDWTLENPGQRVGAGCPAKARPVWLSDTTVYFYDDVANAAQPWRKAIDRSSYSTSVPGITLESPCIPDAFGVARCHTKNRTRFTCGRSTPRKVW